ncbi:hypothetical protein BGX21_008651 [Mortierella sp. AD011]|nr:hypothetical protein BGX20_008706 [Mortierella sp. AD010]KAF9397637.1 hypothetical protein BGX21_008651 [Mortierella sp. AD011]
MARSTNPELTPIESYHQWQERICRWADAHFEYPHAFDVVLHMDVYIRKNVPQLVKLQPSEDELWAAEEALDELVIEHYRARIPSPRDDTLLRQRFKREILSIQPGAVIFRDIEPASGPHIPFQASIVRLLEENKPAKRQRLDTGSALTSSGRGHHSERNEGRGGTSSSEGYNVNNHDDDYDYDYDYDYDDDGDDRGGDTNFSSSAHYNTHSTVNKSNFTHRATSRSSNNDDAYFNNPSANSNVDDIHELSDTAAGLVSTTMPANNSTSTRTDMASTSAIPPEIKFLNGVSYSKNSITVSSIAGPSTSDVNKRVPSPVFSATNTDLRRNSRVQPGDTTTRPTSTRRSVS